MGIKKILSIAFQVPAWLILLGAFLTGVYGWIFKIQNIKIWTPLIMLIVITLYIIGRWVIKEDKELENEETAF